MMRWLERWLYAWPLRLRSLFRRREVDQELDEELRYHVERQIQEQIAKGLAREQARTSVLRAFGGVERRKEECRDTRHVNLAEDTWKDVSHAVRLLRRNPGFTVVVVLTLALGIGAATAIFSVAYGVLFRSLPYEDPEQLVRIYETNRTYERDVLSPPNFMSVREQARAFTDIVNVNSTTQTLMGRGEARWVDGSRVSAGFFEVMGAKPILGRTFVERENLPGSDGVVVLGHSLWQELGGRANIIGQALTLHTRRRVVVGVLAPGFDFPSGARFWVPREYDEEFSASTAAGRRNNYLTVVGRLRDGIATGDAESELDLVADRLKEQFPETNRDTRFTIEPLHDVLVSSARTPLLFLLAAVGLLLLIACANVAGLLLARAASRREELAVRAAIGAGRGRLVRQFLAESLLVASIGGAVGLLLATWATQLIVAAQPEELPRLDAIRADGAVLAFGFGVTLLTTLLVGLAPAFQATGVAGGLREGSRGRTTIRSGVRLRAGLVAAELALAVVLLSGAGLLIRSFVRMISTDPGFRTERVLTFEISLPSTRYDSDAAHRAYYEDLIARIRALPGVERTGAVFNLPILTGGYNTRLTIEGRSPADPLDAPSARYRSVTPGYFETMGIPVLRGRGITELDREGTPRVVVINETAARRLFRGEDPVGQRIRISSSSGGGEPLTVVGIAGDVVENRPTNIPEPQIFLPFDQAPRSEMNVVVRSHGADPLALAPAVRHTLQQVDSNVLGQDFQTLERIVGDSLARERSLSALLGLFASAALLLASIGVFGLLSFTVAERTREIGVRIALGAARREIMTMVLRDALKLAGVGLVIGLTGALLVGRLLEGLLYEVSPTDPTTIAMMAALLLLVALLASWWPARRAAQVDPMTALRHE